MTSVFRKHAWYLAAAALVCVHVGILTWEAAADSPTLNEPGHLAAGISYWQLGRFELYCVNPPLVRLIAALPVLAAGCETDWKRFTEGAGARPESPVGDDFIAANGERSFWLFTLARWTCIPFSLLGALVCFSWARELYGQLPGLLALTLWCFCPNIVAHGQLVTPDVGATAMGAAACYTYWHWLKRPTWGQTLITGFTLGLAEITKTTLVIFFPLWPAMWVAYRWPQRDTMTRRDWLREAGMLVSRMLIAVFVINQAYAFEGSLTRLGDFRFVSRTLTGIEEGRRIPKDGANRFTGSWIERLPVPLPKQYVIGIDLQKSDFESYGQPSYLRGEWRDHGWWYYYLYALGVKVPLGTWCLLGLAVFTNRRNTDPHVRRDEMILLVPCAAILCLVSSQTGLNQHMRYVLPIFPLLFVWTARAVGAALWRRIFITGALLWSILSLLLVYPHCLAYFNELAGGPDNGPRHLLHSNIDWGQDLLKLKKWLELHPESRPLKLAYFGPATTGLLGVDFTLPPDGRGGATPCVERGCYAISVNLLCGTEVLVRDGRGRWHLPSRGAYAYLGRYRPTARIGGSIYVYRIDGTESH